MPTPVLASVHRARGVVAPLVLLGCSTAGSPDYGHIAAERTGDLSVGPATRGAFDRELTEACGPGGLTDAGAASVLRRPYLQDVKTDSVLLHWTARSDAPVSVEVRAGDTTTPSETGPTNARASIDAGGSTPDNVQYSARLGGLEPGTVYCYEVRGPDGSQLASAGFRTAPLPASDEPVRFVALGDSGTRSPDQAAVIGALQSVPFSLILHVGDLAYREGSLAQLERNLFQPFASIMDRVPLYPAMGNHDYRTRRGEPFRQVFALPENGRADSQGVWYSFDHGDVHFVVLDTVNMDGDQTAWLESDLRANRSPWTVVALHHPPYSSGEHGGDQRVIEAWVPLFEAYGVKLVLSGHDHNYERTHPINGVTYIVTGGGGGGTRGVGESEFTAFSESVAHFVHAEVTRGELRLRAIDGTGAEFDGVLLEVDR